MKHVLHYIHLCRAPNWHHPCASTGISFSSTAHTGILMSPIGTVPIWGSQIKNWLPYSGTQMLFLPGLKPKSNPNNFVPICGCEWSRASNGKKLCPSASTGMVQFRGQHIYVSNLCKKVSPVMDFLKNKVTLYSTLTSYQQHTNSMPAASTAYQQHTNNIPTACQQLTNSITQFITQTMASFKVIFSRAPFLSLVIHKVQM